MYIYIVAGLQRALRDCMPVITRPLLLSRMFCSDATWAAVVFQEKDEERRRTIEKTKQGEEEKERLYKIRGIALLPFAWFIHHCKCIITVCDLVWFTNVLYVRVIVWRVSLMVSHNVWGMLDYNILFAVRVNSSGNIESASHGGLMLKELSVRVERLSKKDTARYAKAAAF